MRPLDPRLLRRARSARRYVLLTAALGSATAALVVGQALLLAHVLAPLVTGDGALDRLRGPLLGLVAVVLARAVVVGAQERFAHRAATRTVAELRSQVVAHVARAGPRGRVVGTGETAVLATRGLEALEPYLVRYLPQLLLAATVTPATLAVVLGLDLVAALTIAVTLPLVPLFMWLVGVTTQHHARRRMETMTRLGHQVLDLLAGLPTLRALGRERGPATHVARLGEEHRRATMGTLRVAFLSGAVLELLTTLSVALVAVGVGFRLVYGQLDLTTALAVLVLAPEVYLPLRQVGVHFHAAADGVASASRALDLLDTPLPVHGVTPAGRPTGARLEGVTVRGAEGAAPDHLDLVVEPGRLVVLAGPNGSGKSTAVAVLLGLVRPDRGRVVLTGPDGERDLAELDPATWWARVAWVPQRPVVEGGAVRDLLADPPVEDAVLATAAARTGLGTALRSRAGATGPAGAADPWSLRLGRGGEGLSLGERRRLALTRAVLRDVPVVLVDEPTAHLDADARADLTRMLRLLADEGRAVLAVSHDPAVLEVADDVVRIAGAPSADALTSGTTAEAGRS